MGKYTTLMSLVEDLKSRGEATAVVAVRQDGAESWSYAELAETIERMASGLIQLGVSRAEPIALLAANRPEWIASYFAILGAGALAVPIDNLIGEAELARVIADCGCRRIFTTEDHLATLRALDRDGHLEPILLGDGGEVAGTRFWRDLLSDRGETLSQTRPQLQPDDPASLLYTSGTTGTAKGIALSHRNFLSNLEAILAAGLARPGDRILIPLPFHHSYPFTTGLLTALASGCVIVLPEGTSGPQILQALKEAKVTTMIGVPRLYAAMVDGIKAKVAARGGLAAKMFHPMLALSIWLRRRFRLRIGRILFRPLHNEFGPSLHLLGCGGARLEPEVEWQLEGLGWEVLSGYGLTETAPILTFNPRGRERIGSTGLPLGNVELRIVTADGDEFGEVQARGPNVFAGYWNNPEATHEVFTADNWFRTGDLGYLDEDGYLFLVGRSKELIVLADGKNIFPEEIEAVIAESPFILDVAVLEHEGVLVGVIVPDADAVRDRGLARVEALLREQIEFATAGLAPYQRLSGFALYQDDLPRTHLGKLRRHLLTEIYQGAKAGKRPKAPVAHGDEDLALLAIPRAKQVWDWLTALYPDQPLHLDDSPQLDLGIDSLKWVTLTLEMEERFGISITEDAITRVTSLRDFLHEVIAAGAAGPGPEGAGGGVLTLSVDQERWLKPTGPVLSILGWMLYQPLRAIMRHWFRLTVKGIDRLPESGPYILAPNHTSYLDSVALMATLTWRQFEHTYWAGWTGLLFRGAITNLFSRMARIFPVDPDRSPGLGLAYGLGTLERRNVLVWFPEGMRSPTGELGQFLPGIGVLVDTSKVPVLPVLIEGGFEAMPVGEWLPRRHRITVIFGKPLTASELDAAGEGPDQATRIANALHDAVARLGE